MNRIASIDRSIKIEEKIKKAIKEGKNKEHIWRLFLSLEHIEYKIDRIDDYSK